MKVLIIDDEEDIRRVIRLVLERMEGMTVCEASGGLEGLTAARQERPDAILLDVKMWGMDGPAVLRALRGIPETVAIPVIFITASASPEETQRAFGLGVTGVIAKPFDPMTLAAQLHALLKPAAPPAQGPDPGAGDFASVLKDLNQEYRSALPAKLARLTELAGRAQAAPGDAESRGELETAVHNMHGTAGSYGFARVSRILGEWDLEMKADAGKSLQPAQRAAHFLGVLAASGAAAEEPVSAPPTPPSAAVRAAEAPRVLIVDDDPDLAAFFAALLRADGLRVETAAHGRAALERLDAARPALIISDIAMPDMSGYELCRAVRARGFQDIPFIFCTALGEPALRIEGLRCGADDYLVKPVDTQELRLKVRNLLARQQQPRESVPATAEIAPDAGSTIQGGIR